MNFKFGNRVLVTNKRSEYYGLTGKVTDAEVSGSRYSVLLDHNGESRLFMHRELKLVEEHQSRSLTPIGSEFKIQLTCIVHGKSHRHDIPLEWEYCVVNPESGQLELALTASSATIKRVSKLGCACGNEVER